MNKNKQIILIAGLALGAILLITAFLSKREIVGFIGAIILIATLLYMALTSREK